MRNKYEVHLVIEDGPEQQALGEHARWLGSHDLLVTVEGASPAEARRAAVRLVQERTGRRCRQALNARLTSRLVCPHCGQQVRLEVVQTATRVVSYHVRGDAVLEHWQNERWETPGWQTTDRRVVCGCDRCPFEEKDGKIVRRDQPA